MAKIQVKRGLQSAVSNLVLAEGEFAVALDTGNVYVGTTAGTVHVNPKGGTSETATKLETARPFSISGDGTATSVNFDGTAGVDLVLVLNTISTLSAGTYAKVTVDGKGRVTAGTTLSVSDIPTITTAKISDMPTNLSDFTNDEDFANKTYVDTAIANLIGSAPETLDTLQELADALNDDDEFSTTVTNELANKEALIKNATEKVTVVDNDTIPISDSAASSTTKKIKFSVLKSTLKTYFDTLYNKYVHPSHTAHDNGFYKVTVDDEGHVTSAIAVSKSDITALGIPSSDTTYTVFRGATSTLDGSTGLVTKPLKANVLQFLRGDGTWATPTNTTYGVATNTTDGLMSGADKLKLDGIEENANNYSHPSYTSRTNGLYKVTVDASGHVSNAVTVVKSDITALGIPSQDTVYTLPSASATVMGGVKVGSGLAITSSVLSVGDIDGGTF